MKFQVAQPILSGLGWDTSNPDLVHWEYAVTSPTKGRIDVALQGDSEPLAFLELKAPGKRLDDHLGQVVQYAFAQGVDICVLTDGFEWRFYLPRASRSFDKRQFAETDLRRDSPESAASTLRAFLDRDRLGGGEAVRDARRALRALREAEQLAAEGPKIWREMCASPSDELTALVRREIAARTRLEPSDDQVRSIVSGSEVGPIRTEGRERLGSDPAPSTSTKKKPSKRRWTPGTPPAGYRLWGTFHPATTHKAVLVGVLEALHERHGADFEKLLELKGRKRPWLTLDPDDLHRSARIGQSPYHADVNLSAASIAGRIAKFLKELGHLPDSFEIVMD